VRPRPLRHAAGHVLSDLERKLRLRDDYGGILDNTTLATL
jgi:hypothetical protein